ncbi:hypothetical protein ETC05_08120 [Geobacillus sp. BMUD]|nr:hypothetical protein [Geobacillus sp. BMUD]
MSPTLLIAATPSPCCLAPSTITKPRLRAKVKGMAPCCNKRKTKNNCFYVVTLCYKDENGLCIQGLADNAFVFSTQP